LSDRNSLHCSDELQISYNAAELCQKISDVSRDVIAEYKTKLMSVHLTRLNSNVGISEYEN